MTQHCCCCKKGCNKNSTVTTVLIHELALFALGFSTTVRAVRAGPSLSPQIMSAANPACNSCSNVTYSVSHWSPWTANSGRGWHSPFCWSGPRTGASGENVSPPTTGLPTKSVVVRRFRRGEKRFCLWTSRLQVLQGKSETCFTQIFKDLTA